MILKRSLLYLNQAPGFGEKALILLKIFMALSLKLILVSSEEILLAYVASSIFCSLRTILLLR